MDYRTYQAGFSQALTAGEGGATFFKGEAQNRAALAIYRNNVIYSLREVLGEDFPVVKQLLGADAFNALAVDFARHTLPNAADLSTYGGGFADFIETHAALTDLPYLSDVARLENACREVYYGEQEQPIDPAQLSAMSESDIAQTKFFLRPTTRVLSLVWAVDEIWQAHQQIPIPAMEAQQKETFLLLCLDSQSSVEFFRLSEDKAHFLSLLDGKTSLEQATKATLTKFPRFNLTDGLSLGLSKQLFATGGAQ